MSEDAADTAIVGGIVELAHNLGLEVVAEGVEDKQTFHQLADLGCDVVQGWLPARRCPPASSCPGSMSAGRPAGPVPEAPDVAEAA